MYRDWGRPLSDGLAVLLGDARFVVGGLFVAGGCVQGQVQAQDVLMVGGAALLLSFLATLYPAWRAARTQPAQALTYVGVSLQTGANRQRLDARLTLPDGQPLAVNASSRLPRRPPPSSVSPWRSRNSS